MSLHGCVAWEAEANLVDYCPCNSCNLECMLELPFNQVTKSYIHQLYDTANHDEDCAKITRAAERAEAAIIRLMTFQLLKPRRANRTINAKIIKHLLLILSIALYDAQYVDYNGPDFYCDCPNKHAASKALKRLTCVCLSHNISTTPIWSFMSKSPRVSLDILRF